MPASPDLTTTSGGRPLPTSDEPARPGGEPVVIGVSFAVPEPWGSEVQQRRIGYGDPEASCIPTHVTVLPPTEVSPEDLPAVREHLRAAASRVAPFRMILRGTGTFRPISPVVFIQVARGISSCERLETVVRSGPLAREVSFPYHPHVTLAQGCPDDALDRAFAEMADFAAEFDVTELTLYSSPGGHWRAEESFPLGG